MTCVDVGCKRNKKIEQRITVPSLHNFTHSALLTTVSEASKPPAQHDAQQISNNALLRLFEIAFVDVTQLVCNGMDLVSGMALATRN